MKLHIDDRISILLPGHKTEAAGRVIAFDIDGQPKGVLIELDRPVDGTRTVYVPRDAEPAVSR